MNGFYGDRRVEIAAREQGHASVPSSKRRTRPRGPTCAAPQRAAVQNLGTRARLGQESIWSTIGGTMADDTNDAATTVLVVEDDFDLRDALVPILEYEGHRVVSAANGREALDWLHAMPPPPRATVRGHEPDDAAGGGVRDGVRPTTAAYAHGIFGVGVMSVR